MYIAMRLVEGGSLADMLDGKPLSLYLACDIITQVGSALEYAHSHGVVHRDIKPSNLLIDEHGNCMISDFGLAKVLSPSAPISMTGTVIGTPAYMSPEQIMSEEVDGRSDLYSLGIVLFEMLTCLPPFKADSTAIVLIRHIQDPLPSARLLNPQLPLAVERVLEKTLAKKPDERYKSANDLVAAVSHATSGDEAEVVVEETSVPQFSRRWLVALLPLGLIILCLSLEGWASVVRHSSAACRANGRRQRKSFSNCNRRRRLVLSSRNNWTGCAPLRRRSSVGCNWSRIRCRPRVLLCGPSRWPRLRRVSPKQPVRRYCAPQQRQPRRRLKRRRQGELLFPSPMAQSHSVNAAVGRARSLLGRPPRAHCTPGARLHIRFHQANIYCE